ncbi:MAG: Y-family DNA polymerase [Bacteroidetes bacterium]|nr:Y-family DNA polymerase [Bacteroidota bacterium]
MQAIVDCNSFYCACERLFQPQLQHAPVVVLSNNDGCIVSRSDEAKQLGINMAIPYFQAKELIEKNKVHAFSSNYHLYGDLSWRVMETMRQLVPPGCVEVYSVDEAFINLDHIASDQLQDYCVSLKKKIETWTGISVSIGVGPNKVLSKVANRLAKKSKLLTGCVVILNDTKKIQAALQSTPIDDVWGIGYSYSEKLKTYGINTAYALSIKDLSWGKRFLGGVPGMKLIRELKGMHSHDMQAPRTSKKMIATTRMFGRTVSEWQEIEEALATYATRTAEKLRRQHSAAYGVSVFLLKKTPPQTDISHYHHGRQVSGYVKLDNPSNLTPDIIKAVVALGKSLYEQGELYKKAGVILSDFVPDNALQTNLFVAPKDQNRKKLMNVIDNMNAAFRDDILKFATSGTQKNWKMRSERRSKRYTTRWDELCLVR